MILVTHQKVGVGKSTLTFNLAQNIYNNAKIALLDFDIISFKGETKSISNLELK
ncbi:nucleotide-binding protein [Polaribacter sp. L3A8]|uniref:nucleotide-binding protein n=1 Tax=Polaribacter sp. L3A8 TaxID=2686361 RepID=UPI001E574C58|nr:P-loop NTPase [Polaribacter sp. L3A8]